MKTLLIANPIAGAGRALAAARQAQAAYPRAQAELYLTKAPTDATQKAAQAVAAGFDCIVAVGGDGTVNEVAQALIHTPALLGIVPVGSGNGLARHLGYAMQPVQAFGQVLAGHIQVIDHGTANGKPFFTTFGLGFEGLVSQAFAQQGGSRGLVRYVALALGLYRTFPPFTARLNLAGQLVPFQNLLSITFGNANQFGNNFYICPDASLADGLLDLTLLRRQGTWRTLNLIQKALRQQPFHQLAHQQKLAQCAIQCDNAQPFHLDGEYAGVADEFDVRIVPASLNVICIK